MHVNTTIKVSIIKQKGKTFMTLPHVFICLCNRLSPFTLHNGYIQSLTYKWPDRMQNLPYQSFVSKDVITVYSRVIVYQSA